MTDQNTTDKTDLRPRRRPTIPAMAATIALGGLVLAIGVGLGKLADADLPPVAPVKAVQVAADTTGTPTPAPEAAGPSQPATARPVATYGSTGLAGGYAKQLGYASMSEACEAGVTWTCDVHKVETAANNGAYGSTPTGRNVRVKAVPMDPDAVAAEFLAASPAGITRITVTDVSGLMAQDVGTATREAAAG